jgi:hypothetical protein
LDEAVEFGGGGLIEAGLLADAGLAQGLQEADGAEGHDVAGVLGDVEGDAHVALRAEVVDLVRGDLVHHLGEAAGVGEVAVMEQEAGADDVRVLVEVVDALGVEARRAADHAVDLVAFGEQQLGEVGAVLPGDACDECAFHGVFSVASRSGFEDGGSIAHPQAPSIA